MSKEGACKIIGIISAILGLILIVMSCLFLAKILECDDGKIDYGHYPEFNNHQKPNNKNSDNKYNKRRPERQLGLEKYGGKQNYKTHKLDVSRFTASAACGIIFGTIQLIVSGIYCFCLNKKNCKKLSMLWAGIHIVLIIALIGVLIGILTFDWEKVLKYSDEKKDNCFVMNKAYLALVGVDFILLVILCGTAIWCSRKPDSDYDAHQQQEETVKFNKQ